LICGEEKVKGGRGGKDAALLERLKDAGEKKRANFLELFSRGKKGKAGPGGKRKITLGEQIVEAGERKKRRERGGACLVCLP